MVLARRVMMGENQLTLNGYLFGEQQWQTKNNRVMARADLGAAVETAIVAREGDPPAMRAVARGNDGSRSGEKGTGAIRQDRSRILPINRHSGNNKLPTIANKGHDKIFPSD
jgi:hypothetical protein